MNMITMKQWTADALQIGVWNSTLNATENVQVGRLTVNVSALTGAHNELPLERHVLRVVAALVSRPIAAGCQVNAKFHYTGPTGPDQTRADPHGLCRRPARTQRSFSETRPQKSPCGSGRARVSLVEFSYNTA